MRVASTLMLTKPVIILTRVETAVSDETLTISERISPRIPDTMALVQLKVSV
jgi:hypothetical protein